MYYYSPVHNMCVQSNYMSNYVCALSYVLNFHWKSNLHFFLKWEDNCLEKNSIKLLKSWEKVVYFFRIWKILGTHPILLHGERGLGRLYKLTPLSLPNDIRGHTASARFVPLRGLCQCSDRSEQWVRRHIWCLWSKYISLRIYTTNPLRSRKYLPQMHAYARYVNILRTHPYAEPPPPTTKLAPNP